MFHSSHIHIPRNRQPSALRTFVTSSSFGPTETKEPLRRGILFTTVASVLLLVGGILTWLGFNDVFGGKVSMTGPLLIALALLLLLLSMRQFLIARKRNNSTRNGLQLGQMGHGTVTAVVVDRNDGMGAVTVIMDAVNVDHEPQVRNYASNSVEDYAPPSYNEVTQWSGGTDLPPGGQPPDHDEPPPPYEEAVSGGRPSTSSRRVEDAMLPVYASQHAGGSTLPGQVPGMSSCYNRRMFPTSGCSGCSGGGMASHSESLSAADLTHGSNRPWASAKRFLLIPHFLGVLANSRHDLAGPSTGELPPAYQAVDTTGCSPVPYVQAVNMDNLLVPGNERLGVQSPHESRTIVESEETTSAEQADVGETSDVQGAGSDRPVTRSSDRVSTASDTSNNTTVSCHQNSGTPPSNAPSSHQGSHVAGHHVAGHHVAGHHVTGHHSQPSLSSAHHPGTHHHPGNRHPSQGAVGSSMTTERSASPATSHLFLLGPRAHNCSIIDELEEVV